MSHSRKTAMKAALAYAGITASAWCEERGITMSHLYAVLSEKRESARLNADIDAFIEKHTPTASAA